jgi:hypothetical protein
MVETLTEPAEIMFKKWDSFPITVECLRVYMIVLHYSGFPVTFRGVQTLLGKRGVSTPSLK